jgi:hypothetical protein
MALLDRSSPQLTGNPIPDYLRNVYAWAYLTPWLTGLLDRQVSGLLALENAAGVDAALTVRIRKAVSVADEAACYSVLSKWVHRGDRMAKGQCGELLAPAIEEWIAADHERGGSQSG